MASRNPDRISIVDMKVKGETVADMQAAHWLVIARCFTCHLELDVDLARVIRERGPSTSLWNREAKCRRRGCAGKVLFFARAPGMMNYDMLVASREPKEKAWKRGRVL